MIVLGLLPKYNLLQALFLIIMPLAGEGDSMEADSRTSILGKGSMCKGPEVEKSSECLRTRRRPVGRQCIKQG